MTTPTTPMAPTTPTKPNAPTKPTDRNRIAVALSYDRKSAPRVTAKGRGEVATAIIELANKHDVPLQETPELAGLLSRVELGDEIPQALYNAVAEVIAFAYFIRGDTPDKMPRTK